MACRNNLSPAVLPPTNNRTLEKALAVTKMYYISLMRKIICPHCEQPATGVADASGYKFYCPHCGWNVEVVRSELSSAMKISAAILVAILTFAAYLRVRYPQDPAMPMIALVISVLPAYYSLSALFQRHKLRNLSMQPIAGRQVTFTISEGSSSKKAAQKFEFKEKEFPDLLLLARPRKLRMNWKGWLYILVAVSAVCLCTIYLLPGTWKAFTNPESKHFKDWTLFLAPAVIYAYSFVFFRKRVRERELLANGEITSGYVFAQNNGNYDQSIEFYYKVSDAQMLAGRCTDASRSVYEGMVVPVFYDAQNPTRCIPLDCSLTQIART